MTGEPIRTADECARHLIEDEGWEAEDARRAVDEIVADRDDDRMTELEWDLALRPYVDGSEHQIARYGVVRSGRHVYIGEGGQIGYLPSSVKSAVWA